MPVYYFYARKVFLACLAILFTLPLFAQWEALPSAYDHPWGLTYKFVLSEDGTIWEQYEPFMLPSSGAIYRSTNQGNSWDSIAPPYVGPIFIPFVFSMFALDSNHVWVTNGQIDTSFNYQMLAFYASADGGESWDTLSLPQMDLSTEYILESHFYDQDTGIVFVSGNFTGPIEEARAYRTFDGGQSWMLTELPIEPFEDTFKSAPNYGYVYRGDTIWTGTTQGRILRSVNRGADWEVFQPVGAPPNPVESIAFQDHLRGIMTIRDFSAQLKASAYRTTDGGETWAQVALPPRIFNLSHVPGSGGVYLGATYNLTPGYFISKDGGTTWQRTPDDHNFYYPMVFTSPTEGYAFSPNVSVIGEADFGLTFFPVNVFRRYVGPPLVAEDPTPDFANDFPVVPQGVGLLPTDHYIFSLSAVDQNTVWGSVSSGSGTPATDAPLYVVKTTDGGDNWERMEVAGVTGRASFDIHAVNDQTAFITTNSLDNNTGRGVFRTTDGGSTWSSVLDGAAGGVWLHFFDDAEGIAINREFMAKTLDGGTSWSLIPPANIPGFQDNEFTLINSGTNSLAHYEDNLWFGTSVGHIYHSMDRGQTWTILDSLGANITGISFKNEMEGMAVSPTLPDGFFNIPNDIFVTSDGGNSWTNINNDEGAFLLYGCANVSHIPNTEEGYIITTNNSDNLLLYTLNKGDDWFVHPYPSQFGAIELLDSLSGWAAFSGTVESGIFPSAFKLGDFSVNVEEAFEHQLSISVYPNPTVDILNCDLPTEFEGQTLVSTIIDQTGRIVRQVPHGPSFNKVEIATDDLPDGFYYLMLASPRQRLIGKFLKQ
jgi:photosystem II stability/assembly factor-like uncharacterized protein